MKFCVLAFHKVIEQTRVS